MHQFAYIHCFGIGTLFVVNAVEEFYHFVSNELTQMKLKWNGDTTFVGRALKPICE